MIQQLLEREAKYPFFTLSVNDFLKVLDEDTVRYVIRAKTISDVSNKIVGRNFGVERFKKKEVQKIWNMS